MNDFTFAGFNMLILPYVILELIEIFTKVYLALLNKNVTNKIATTVH